MEVHRSLRQRQPDTCKDKGIIESCSSPQTSRSLGFREGVQAKAKSSCDELSSASQQVVEGITIPRAAGVAVGLAAIGQLGGPSLQGVC